MLFANFQRQVFFVNSQLLSLLNRPETHARQLIGKRLEQVLGIEPEVAKQLLQDVAKVGRIYSRPITLRREDGSPVEVIGTLEATYNEKGECIGADISLRQSAASVQNAAAGTAPTQSHDSSQNNLLPEYVGAQVEALRALLNRVGGPRVAKTLDKILSETIERNAWPVRFNGGRLEGTAPAVDAIVYDGLLVKAVHYSVSVIGASIVEKQLKAGEEHMGPIAVKFANQLGLGEIIHQYK
jgi:hypothetical protein